ncbi:MAG: hypothetical protein ACFFD4_34510 [Candidatus Odinarchaeota archaeon]
MFRNGCTASGTGIIFMEGTRVLETGGQRNYSTRTTRGTVDSS